jgi:hypothetical protein
MTVAATHNPAAETAALIERLCAYASLCEEVAASSQNHGSAERFKAMAQDCLKAAARLAAADPVPRGQRH